MKSNKPNKTSKRTGFKLILFGGPGAGKGTQAKILQEELGLPHIASGDLFRENLRNNTELGQLARKFIDRGELVPDDVTIKMIEERLTKADAKSGFILDGFPRTISQAIALDELLKKKNQSITRVLYLNVADDEIVKRLSGRMTCKDCQAPYHQVFNPPNQSGICDKCGGELFQRDDDKPETVRARLKTFHDQTSPLIEHYRKLDLIFEVQGDGEVSDITRRLLEAARLQ